MKKTQLIRLATVGILTSLSVAHAQSPSPGSSSASSTNSALDSMVDTSSEPLSNAQIRAILSAHPWTWSRVGFSDSVLNFATNGKAATSDWTAAYRIVSSHTIVLHLDTRTARLKFSDDYSSYTGVDYDTVTKLTGKPVLK